MKRAVLLLLLLIPLALAEETILHDDWHEYHDFFQVDDDYFEVINEHYISDEEVVVKTLLKKNQEGFIITSEATEPDDSHLFAFVEGEEFCRSSGVYRFCVTGISYDTSEGARSDEGGRYRFGTHIKVYEDRPETAFLELERSAPEKLFFGEDGKVTLRLKNVGAEKATNISFTEVVDDCLTISDRKDLLPGLNNKLTATSNELFPDGELVFSYKVTPRDYCNTSTLKATFSYDDSVEQQTGSGSRNVLVPWPFSKKFSAGKHAKINQPLLVTYTLKNLDQQPIDARIVFKPDTALQIKDFDNLRRSGFNYVQTLMLEPGQEESFTLSLTNKYTGSYNVSVEAELEVNDHHFTTSEKASLSFKTDTITPSITLSKMKSRSGEPVTIGFYLHNEDDELAFHQVKGRAYADFFEDAFELKKISKNAHENVIFKTYYPPTTDNITTHVIELEGTFLTTSNQEKSFYTQKELLVYPKNMSILLFHTTDKSSLKRGDNLTVSVSVENVADSGSNFVQVRDVFGDELQKVFGSANGESYLYGGEERELYVYQLQVPLDYNKDSFTITSTLTAQGQSLSSVEKTVVVSNPLNTTTEEIIIEEEEVNVTQEPDEEVIDEPAVKEEKEGNVLVRLIDGIANFFANFF